MARVFVTGGSGFVGGALIRSLVADGAEVRALARSTGSERAVAEAGAEPVPGDLGSPDAIRAGAEGCELAFHAAAMPEEWGPRELFERVNVEGTRTVCEACVDAGVRRLVHVGTEAALLSGEPLVEVDETAPLRPDSKALYSSTKAKAEQIVISANGGNIETVVLRPRLVWGPGDQTILPGLIEAVESGQFAWIGGGGHKTSTTHIDNCVHGLRLAAEHGNPGEAYFVTDGEPVRFREFVTALLETAGIDPPGRSLPPAVAKPIAAAGEGVWRLLPLPGKPPLTRLALWLSSLETTIDISKAERELGYSPVMTREQGLAELSASTA